MATDLSQNVYTSKLCDTYKMLTSRPVRSDRIAYREKLNCESIKL